MQTRVIAAPPTGIYGKELTGMGHAFYLVALDVLARYKKKFHDENIIFPSKAYNTFGKKADTIMKKNGFSIQENQEYINGLISKDVIRDKLNLSSLEILLDNDPIVKKGVTDDFITLKNKKLLIKKGNSYFLDCEKISRIYDLKAHLNKISCKPERAKQELNRFIENNMNLPLEITKTTNFSLENPFGGDKIGPLFVLANLWDHKYPESKYTIASSNNTLCKYVFLRFISQIALNNSSNIDEIIVWPRVHAKENLETWKLESLLEDEFNSDMLRYVFLRRYSNNRQKINISKGMLDEGRKFVYLISNLSKFFANGSKNIKPYEKLDNFEESMEQLDFQIVLESLYKMFKDISKDISNLTPEISHKKENLKNRYISLLDISEIFVPATVKLAKRRLENAHI